MSSTYSCSPNLKYVGGAILFVLASFMAFNEKLELSGVWLLLIFSASTVVQAGIAAYTTTPIDAGNTGTWLRRVSVWGSVLAAVMCAIAAAMLTSVFMSRTSLARLRDTDREFGNQERRKNSVKKMLVAASVFIQMAIAMHMPEIKGYIQYSLVRANRATVAGTGANVAAYAALAATLIAAGISLSAMTEMSSMLTYLATL